MLLKLDSGHLKSDSPWNSDTKRFCKNFRKPQTFFEHRMNVAVPPTASRNSGSVRDGNSSLPAADTALRILESDSPRNSGPGSLSKHLGVFGVIREYLGIVVLSGSIWEYVGVSQSI